MVKSLPVAIVTGGARRIGRAIVEDLAAHGWAVAIHCHSSENDATTLAAGIEKAGGRVEIFRADLADMEAARKLVPAVARALGKPSLLVNNASIYEADDIGRLDAALWQRQIAVNLTAPIFLADAFAAALPKGVEGNIINIADQRVWKPTPRYFSYQLSKSALWAATQSLAQALAPRIRVNAIAPGPTLRNDRQTEADFKRQTDAILLRHGAELTEFGRTIRYFLENRSITGQMIALDGGQHLAWRTPDVAHYET
jgi:NAD(P)-dependent dehydrogenase (short-subunit alcohol dehydrogenase family)